jgi:hypothetical protein
LTTAVIGLIWCGSVSFSFFVDCTNPGTIHSLILQSTKKEKLTDPIRRQLTHTMMTILSSQPLNGTRAITTTRQLEAIIRHLVETTTLGIINMTKLPPPPWLFQTEYPEKEMPCDQTLVQTTSGNDEFPLFHNEFIDTFHYPGFYWKH